MGCWQRGFTGRGELRLRWRQVRAANEPDQAAHYMYQRLWVGTVNKKHFVSDPFGGSEFELFGVGEAGDVVAIGDGRCVSAADDFRAEGEMDFIDKISAEKSAV